MPGSVVAVTEVRRAQIVPSLGVRERSNSHRGKRGMQYDGHHRAPGVAAENRAVRNRRRRRRERRRLRVMCDPL